MTNDNALKNSCKAPKTTSISKHKDRCQLSTWDPTNLTSPTGWVSNSMTLLSTCRLQWTISTKISCYLMLLNVAASCCVLHVPTQITSRLAVLMIFHVCWPGFALKAGAMAINATSWYRIHGYIYIYIGSIVFFSEVFGYNHQLLLAYPTSDEGIGFIYMSVFNKKTLHISQLSAWYWEDFHYSGHTSILTFQPLRKPVEWNFMMFNCLTVLLFREIFPVVPNWKC